MFHQPIVRQRLGLALPVSTMELMDQPTAACCRESLPVHEQSSTSADHQSSTLWERVVDPDTGEVFAIEVCQPTGLYVTRPVPGDLSRYYTDRYHGNRHGFTARYCDYRRRRIIERAVDRSDRPPRWLDVGCGDGTLLQALQRRGWDARGVEAYTTSARTKGLTVYDSLAQAAEDGPYDGISLWHVLEHLTDPGHDLTLIRRLLQPAGVLIIAVPDAGCLAARWFGPHWLHWDVPRHLYHFTARSLQHLLEAHGLAARQLRQSEFEYDLLGFAQSVLNAMGLGQNAFFQLLTHRRVDVGACRRWSNLVLGTLLCGAAALPQAWRAGVAGRYIDFPSPCPLLNETESYVQGQESGGGHAAYNAEKTLLKTYAEIDRSLVDEIILVDDASVDRTVAIAQELGLHVLQHPKNRGYGGNQKTCYKTALRLGADIVVMLHPDYQYTPLLIPAMVPLIGNGLYDCVIGSRILGGRARLSGMPLYKYVANRGLTLAQNLMMGSKLTEFHTGYRAFSRELLLELPLEENSDDFVFDNQMLAQVIQAGFRVGEVSCPTKYFAEASSINFRRSTVYGLGCLLTASQFRLSRLGIYRARIFRSDGQRLEC